VLALILCLRSVVLGENGAQSIEAFCLGMLSSGSFNLKNRWYAPAPRVRVHHVPEMEDRNETIDFYFLKNYGFLVSKRNYGDLREKSS